MKRLFVLILSVLLLCGCSQDPEPTDPTNDTEDTAPDRPTADSTQPSESAIHWDEYSDYELMEAMLNDDIIGFRSISSYYFTDQEWLMYVMENCEPFRELMFRQTALDSLRQYAPQIIEEHRDDSGLNSWGFEDLVEILIPEMDLEQLLPAEPTEISWLASEAYSNFLRASMGTAAPLRYLHFEVASLEIAFVDSFTPYTDASIVYWHKLSDTLYAVTTRVFTESTPVGEEVTHFVGCIDDQWQVMISVDQIPAELKAGLNLSLYEYMLP